MPFSLIAGAKSGCCSSKRRTRFIAPCLSPCSSRVSAWWTCRIREDSAGWPVLCARATIPAAEENAAKIRSARRRFAAAPIAMQSRVILRELDPVLGRFAGDYSLPFTDQVEPVSRQIGEHFLFPIRPQDFGLIDALMAAQPEVQA